MKCPVSKCIWRSRDDGACIAPLDERIRKKCPLPETWELTDANIRDVVWGV